MLNEYIYGYIGEITLRKYIRIPKKIIYKKDIDCNRVLIWSYLYTRRSFDDTVSFSVNEIYRWAGKNADNRNKKYLSVLVDFSTLGYLGFDDYMNMSGNTYHCVNIKNFDNERPFGIIYLDELNQILEFKSKFPDIKRITSAHILLLLSYIRVNLNNNSPLCCYRLYKTISDDTGIPLSYISTIVYVLEELNILRIKELPKIQYLNSNKDLCFFTNAKVFADYRKYDKNGILDKSYNCNKEINKQVELLQRNFKKVNKNSKIIL